MSTLAGWIFLFSVGIASIPVLGSDRAARKKEILEKALPTAEKTIRDACGCSPKFDIDWKSYQTVKDMRRIHRELEADAKIGREFCEMDPRFKSTFCQQVATSLSKIRVTFGNGQGRHKGTYFEVESNYISHSGGNSLRRYLEGLVSPQE